MVIIPKAIHRFIIIQFKLPWTFFTDLEKNLKTYVEAQNIKNSQRNSDVGDCCVGSITTSKLMLYSRNRIIQIEASGTKQKQKTLT